MSELVAIGTRTCAGQLPLEQRQEAAIGGDRFGSNRNQFGGRVEERLKQAFGLLQHDTLGAGALDHAIQHRKRPGFSIAHVTRNAGKSRLKHQNAERRPIDRLAAARDHGVSIAG